MYFKCYLLNVGLFDFTLFIYVQFFSCPMVCKLTCFLTTNFRCVWSAVIEEILLAEEYLRALVTSISITIFKFDALWYLFPKFWSGWHNCGEIPCSLSKVQMFLELSGPQQTLRIGCTWMPFDGFGQVRTCLKTSRKVRTFSSTLQVFRNRLMKRDVY